jgi:hypothetical protein
MKRIALVLAAAFPCTLTLMVTNLSTTASAQASEPAKPEAKDKPGKKVVCRTVSNTGSRVRKRVCQSIDSWVNDAARANGEVLGVQARGSHLDGQDASAGPN